MNSSRSTTIAIVLILIIVFGWLILNQPKQKPQAPKPAPTAVDSSQIKAAAPVIAQTKAVEHSTVFPIDSNESNQVINIETPLVSAAISGKGGNVISWVLKNYKTHDKKPLELVDQSPNGHSGDINLRFVASDGKTASTKDMAFRFTDSSSHRIGEKDSLTLTAICRIDSGASIIKTYHFHGDDYTIGIDYHLVGLQGKVSGYKYGLVVDNALPYTEASSNNESTTAKAFAGLKAGTEDIDASKIGEPVRKSYNGDPDFVASRTQYFLQAMIPVSPRPVGTDITGLARTAPDGGRIEEYNLSVSIPISSAGNDSLSARYYLGPLEYKRLSNMTPALDRTMDFGWSFLVRPISTYLMMPLFMFLHSFIFNWGLVIIVFSIVVKSVTYPFSRGQMNSMRKMQALQPKITQIKEDYKDDQKKQQEETFKMYRTYGVNPAGGCLPLLLQMPILFSLYAVLRNVIELRQAPFFSWIQDLSVPDGLFKFGTSIPIIGNQLSGLTLLMGITMVIQSALTTTDPRQKKMAYIMPIMFTFLFNNLPSGVALYYFMFNIFGIAQQYYNKKFLPPLDLEQMKATASTKKGFMSRMQDLEKNARQTRQANMAGQLPGKKKKKR
ncbi:MAG: membrane protein insertase YidC [Bacteroidota bacterium]|nr:membrane protein insertase YidC [Bacteroidota bacterium]MDP4228790.1 membrane protein insertase YidC [Bacteroidota bacterium]MDP4237250.1 membrane protein insertase YidC [Bacteroidota bacterium]